MALKSEKEYLLQQVTQLTADLTAATVCFLTIFKPIFQRTGQELKEKWGKEKEEFLDKIHKSESDLAALARYSTHMDLTL